MESAIIILLELMHVKKSDNRSSSGITMAEKIVVRSTNVTRILSSFAAIFAILSSIRLIIVNHSVPGQVPQFIDLFNMDSEINIPILFCIGLLLLAFVLLSFITSINFTRKSPHRFTWLALSMLSLLIALNKAVRFHGYLLRIMVQFVRNSDSMIFLPFIMAFLLVMVIGFLIISFRFIKHLHPKIRNVMLFAWFIYFLGAIILELIGSMFYNPGGQNNQVYQILTIIEETVEMAGVVAFIRVLIIHISDTYSEFHFIFDPAKEEGG